MPQYIYNKTAEELITLIFCCLGIIRTSPQWHLEGEAQYKEAIKNMLKHYFYIIIIPVFKHFKIKFDFLIYYIVRKIA